MYTCIGKSVVAQCTYEWRRTKNISERFMETQESKSRIALCAPYSIGLDMFFSLLFHLNDRSHTIYNKRVTKTNRQTRDREREKCEQKSIRGLICFFFYIFFFDSVWKCTRKFSSISILSIIYISKCLLLLNRVILLFVYCISLCTITRFNSIYVRVLNAVRCLYGLARLSNVDSNSNNNDDNNNNREWKKGSVEVPKRALYFKLTEDPFSAYYVVYIHTRISIFISSWRCDLIHIKWRRKFFIYSFFSLSYSLGIDEIKCVCV